MISRRGGEWVLGVLIEYENKSIKKYFDNLDLMKRKIGKEKTKAVKLRLNQLGASANFSIYLKTGLGKPHPLSENLKGYYGISISANVRLVVRPDTVDLQPKNLEQCETVIIKGVMDYHGRKINWFIP